MVVKTKTHIKKNNLLILREIFKYKDNNIIKKIEKNKIILSFWKLFLSNKSCLLLKNEFKFLKLVSPKPSIYDWYIITKIITKIKELLNEIDLISFFNLSKE